jgi:hypothetical protein
MHKIILLLFISIYSTSYCQENIKIDSLNNELIKLKEQVSELKKKINSEINNEGYYIIAAKKSSYSKLLMKDKKYGEVIDTILVGDRVKIIGKDIGVYKIQYNEKSGVVDSYDLKIDETSVINLMEYNYTSKKSRRSSGSTYVKGHYRKTKSGKRVYVKGHYRKK